MRLVAAGLASVLLAAGCATGSAGSDQPVVSPPPTPATTSSAISASAAPTTSALAASTPPATPTSSWSHAGATAVPTPAAGPSVAPLADPCPAAALAVRLLPGGAAQGVEYAAVSITNNGPVACNLRGYPTVQLRDGSGRVLVAARPLPGSTARVVRLAPGQAAQAQVQDHSTCQAPLSSSVAVAAPPPSQAAAATSDRPLNQLRACTVYVAPVGPAT